MKRVVKIEVVHEGPMKAKNEVLHTILCSTSLEVPLRSIFDPHNSRII